MNWRWGCKCFKYNIYGNTHDVLMEGPITTDRPDYDLLSAKLLLADVEAPKFPPQFVDKIVSAEMDLTEASNPLFNPRYFHPSDLRREWSKVANVLICMDEVQKVYDEAGVEPHPYFVEVRDALEERKTALEDYFLGRAPDLS